MYNGSKRMVGRKRVQFGVEIDVWSVNPDSSAGRIQDFDIRMNLCDGNSQRGSSVNDRVFAEQNDLSRRRDFHDK
jgi:hypothetical protein